MPLCCGYLPGAEKVAALSRLAPGFSRRVGFTRRRALFSAMEGTALSEAKSRDFIRSITQQL
jgi:hypothetical protein